MKNIMTLGVALLSLSACTLSSPSMISSSPIQLSETTMMEQVKFEELNSNVLNSLANHYSKNGVSALDLTMTYDPASSNFTAMKAVHELRHVRQYLAKKGIQNVTSQTQAIPKGTPSLLISYDMVQALAPQNCQTMPGLYREKTTRFLGEYKFGCSVDTMVAKQIAHPADLAGNSDMGINSGRRQAAIINGHLKGEPKAPIVGVERGDLIAE